MMRQFLGCIPLAAWLCILMLLSVDLYNAWQSPGSIEWGNEKMLELGGPRYLDFSHYLAWSLAEGGGVALIAAIAFWGLSRTGQAKRWFGIAFPSIMLIVMVGLSGAYLLSLGQLPIFDRNSSSDSSEGDAPRMEFVLARTFSHAYSVLHDPRYAPSDALRCVSTSAPDWYICQKLDPQDRTCIGRRARPGGCDGTDDATDAGACPGKNVCLRVS